ncbi:TPA: hypothetical protein DEB72_00095 [Patescibacteria group bacterium]|nr:hypothetical protein [Patescibacteria group bacterium]
MCLWNKSSITLFWWVHSISADEKARKRRQEIEASFGSRDVIVAVITLITVIALVYLLYFRPRYERSVAYRKQNAFARDRRVWRSAEQQAAITSLGVIMTKYLGETPYSQLTYGDIAHICFDVLDPGRIYAQTSSGWYKLRTLSDWALKEIAGRLQALYDAEMRMQAQRNKLFAKESGSVRRSELSVPYRF